MAKEQKPPIIEVGSPEWIKIVEDMLISGTKVPDDVLKKYYEISSSKPK